MKLAIIGAGIHGMCTALQAAIRGWDVNIYEQYRIPNPLSSSWDEHRLIRYAYGFEAGYAALVAQAYPAWERLWRVLGVRYYVQTGTLDISSRSGGHIEDSVRTMKQLGLDADVVGEEQVRQICPHITLQRNELALWSQSGGVLLAQSIMTALITACRKHGVRLHEMHPVVDRDTLPRTDCTIWTLGAWSRAIHPSRQIVSFFHPPAAWTMDNHPMVLDLAGSEGFYLVPGVAGTPWKIGLHRASGAGHPDDDRSVTLEEVHRLESAARQRFTAWSDTVTLSGAACYYALADQNRFQLRETPGGFHFAGGSGHSFKFGALFGEMMCSVASGETAFGDVQKLLAGQTFT